MQLNIISTSRAIDADIILLIHQDQVQYPLDKYDPSKVTMLSSDYTSCVRQWVVYLLVKMYLVRTVDIYFIFEVYYNI